MPGVVVYLTFTLMYGGIITHSFSTCKLHLKQSGKVPQPVLFIIPEKPCGEWIIRYLQLQFTLTQDSADLFAYVSFALKKQYMTTSDLLLSLV